MRFKKNQLLWFEANQIIYYLWIATLKRKALLTRLSISGCFHTFSAVWSELLDFSVWSEPKKWQVWNLHGLHQNSQTEMVLVRIKPNYSSVQCENIILKGLDFRTSDRKLWQAGKLTWASKTKWAVDAHKNAKTVLFYKSTRPMYLTTWCRFVTWGPSVLLHNCCVKSIPAGPNVYKREPRFELTGVKPPVVLSVDQLPKCVISPWYHHARFRKAHTRTKTSHHSVA